MKIAFYALLENRTITEYQQYLINYLTKIVEQVIIIASLEFDDEQSNKLIVNQRKFNYNIVEHYCPKNRTRRTNFLLLFQNI